MNNNISQDFNNIKDFTETISKMENFLKPYLPHVYRGTLRNCALVYTYLISHKGAFEKAFSKSYLKERLHLTEIQYVNACKLLKQTKAKPGFISNVNPSKACRYTRWTAVCRKDLLSKGLDKVWFAAQLITEDTWRSYEKVCISNYSRSYHTVNLLEHISDEELTYHLSRVPDDELRIRHYILHKTIILNRLKNIAIGLLYRKFNHKRGIPTLIRTDNDSTYKLGLWNLLRRVSGTILNTEEDLKTTIKDFIRAYDSELDPLYDQLNAYEEARV